MKVRMLTSVAGVDEKGRSYVYEAGEVYELPAGEAKALCSIPADFPRAEPVAEKRAARRETR